MSQSSGVNNHQQSDRIKNSQSAPAEERNRLPGDERVAICEAFLAAEIVPPAPDPKAIKRSVEPVSEANQRAAAEAAAMEVPAVSKAKAAAATLKAESEAKVEDVDRKLTAARRKRPDVPETVPGVVENVRSERKKLRDRESVIRRTRPGRIAGYAMTGFVVTVLMELTFQVPALSEAAGWSLVENLFTAFAACWTLSLSVVANTAWRSELHALVETTRDAKVKSAAQRSLPFAEFCMRCAWVNLGLVGLMLGLAGAFDASQGEQSWLIAYPLAALRIFIPAATMLALAGTALFLELLITSNRRAAEALFDVPNTAAIAAADGVIDTLNEQRAGLLGRIELCKAVNERIKNLIETAYQERRPLFEDVARTHADEQRRRADRKSDADLLEKLTAQQAAQRDRAADNDRLIAAVQNRLASY